MSRGRLFALILAIGLLLGGLIYGSISSVQAECSLCVEYNGQRQCRTGSGADREGARDAAQRAACAVMASGMTATIACENQIPTNLQCSG